MNNENLLVFMHIPKTGGTTLNTIINNQYDNIVIDEHNTMNLKHAEKANAYMGHFYFGIHDHISRPCTYITFMRDSIERMISLYYYIKETDFHPNHAEINTMSFNQFINAEKYDFLSNLQTRYFCAGQTPNLEQAKDVMNKHFSVVGITEMFDESLALMKHRLEWDNIHYQKLNVSQHRPSKNDLPTDTISEIKQKNSLDIALYKYAKERLINELDAMK
ncbi:sulfotransferase family 2 domain-containing protein [Lentibacillus salicampi]|uniref:Sulfotransferase family protein n=1 Tax=Lentibacillus salicampi TaxID=175306 RepID=A0A4Y9A7A9_9BACI|nr:sulfotransferase family 2 domain-containing protein [Lentibacillus salicampi]TFJ91325.1 hypothetical protein E4U82_18200 [Lentibacillus salicampi]